MSETRGGYFTNKTPSPDEMEAALGRIRKAGKITFEMQLGGVWRLIVLTEYKALPNRVRPELTVIFFKPALVVATPYMPSIVGWLSVTESSLTTENCTYIEPNGAEIVGFRPSTPEARDWLAMAIARASGMKFRSHKQLDSSKVVYTETP